MRIPFKAHAAVATLSILVATALTEVPSRSHAHPSASGSSDIAGASEDKELDRLKKEIEGAWLLMSIESRTEFVNPDHVRGFASFQGGYHTVIFGGNEESSESFGYRYRLAINSGAYRYRISSDHTLQIASIMGFSNMTESGDIQYHPSGEAFEYEIRLTDGLLNLTHRTGSKRTYRRLKESAFPNSAISKIQQQGGLNFTDDWDDKW